MPISPHLPEKERNLLKMEQVGDTPPGDHGASMTWRQRFGPLWSFALRGGLFLLPILWWYLLELFVLPIDTFTFRPWEALYVANFPIKAMGRFYPNQHLVKYSVGSHDHSNEIVNPQLKREEWFTDENGYRNRPRAAHPERYDVLLWGDSNIVGAFNDQENILSEVLERRCDCSVYNLGNAEGRAWVVDPNMAGRWPRILVRNVNLHGNPLSLIFGGVFGFQNFTLRPASSWPTEILIIADRLAKQPARERARAVTGATEIRRWANHAKATAGAPNSPPKDDFEKHLKDLIELAVADTKRIISMGTEVIYLIMPYAEEERYRPVLKAMRASGATVIQYPDPGEQKYWNTRDSHWTEEAVRVAADLIASAMRSSQGN